MKEMLPDAVEIHAFRTRDGKWSARVEWSSKNKLKTVYDQDGLVFKIGEKKCLYTPDFLSFDELMTNISSTILVKGVGVYPRKVKNRQ